MEELGALKDVPSSLPSADFTESSGEEVRAFVYARAQLAR